MITTFKKHAVILMFALIFFIIMTSCGKNGATASDVSSNSDQTEQSSAIAEIEESSKLEEPSEPEIDYESVYNEAMHLKQEGDDLHAMQLLMSIYDYKDAHSQYLDMLLDNRISGNSSLLTAVLDDGHVLSFSDDDDYRIAAKNEISAWNSISEIASHSYGVVGLTSNGTAVATADYNHAKWYAGAEKVDGWDDLIQISCGSYHTVGLKKDGTVIATRYIGDAEYNRGQYNVSKWSDIIYVSSGYYHTVGLKSDGTVVACGDNSAAQCNTEDWTDVVQVTASGYLTFGLKKDGTVVSANEGRAVLPTKEIYNSGIDVSYISSWDNIVSISSEPYHVVGLKADGTIVASGKNGNHVCDVDTWSEIRCVVAGSSYTVGVTNEGTIIYLGLDLPGGGALNGYNLFTGEKGEPIVAPLVLPESFPEDIPLYQNLGLIKTIDGINGTTVVFKTSASYEEAFDYYEQWCANRGSYLKQPSYKGDTELLVTPMHDIKKAVLIVVDREFEKYEGSTSENCCVTVSLLGGDDYKSVANLK